MTNIVDINGKQCDLGLAFPIKLGVYKKLMRKGIDPSKNELSQLESMEFMECIISSANPEITEDDCDHLTMDDFMKVSEIINKLSSEKVEAIAPLDIG